MVDFSIADKIYLGDTEVSKLYKGTELLYEKQSSGGVHVKDGKLIFPEGLIVNIDDYTAPEPTTLAYPLPKEVQITGADFYNERFDDGTRFSFHANMEGFNYEYGSNLTQYYSTSSGDTSKAYSGWVSNLTINSTYHYTGGQNRSISAGQRYGIVAFKIDNDCTDASLDLSLYRFQDSSYYYGYKFGISNAYIHDFGTSGFSLDYLTNFYRGYPESGKIDESDIELDLTLNSGITYSYIRKNNLNFQKDHYYAIYGIATKFCHIYSENALCSTIRISIQKEIQYSNYDKDMYISGSGYAFGPDAKDIQISVTDREPHPEFGEMSFGITKYNPTQGWYSLIPPN